MFELINSRGNTISLKDGNSSIGRGSGNVVIISNPRISRKHATILVRGDNVWIRDENSAAGIFVNGTKIVGQGAVFPGQKIQIGNEEFQLKKVAQVANLNPEPNNISEIEMEFAKNSKAELKKPFPVYLMVGAIVTLLIIVFGVFYIYTNQDKNPFSTSTSSLSNSGNSVDLWINAISQSKIILNDNPDFEENMIFYQGISSELNSYVGIIENTRGVLDLVDNLKEMDILLVGNIWDLLIETMESTYPGSGSAIQAIDSGLRAVLGFKDSVDDLSNVQDIIDSSRVFRNDPNKENLIRFDESIKMIFSDLSSINSDLSSINIEIGTLLDNINITISGLKDITGLLDLPGISSTLNSFSNGVNNLLTPVENFYNYSNNLEDQISEDLDLMGQINDLVAKAE